MDHRDVVVALTDMTPETQREAVEALESASDAELDDFAMFVARLMSLDAGRTIGVWAVGALVARWREQVEAAYQLMHQGAAGIFVGVGPGAACTTREVLGIGVARGDGVAGVDNERQPALGRATGNWANVRA